MLHALTVDIEDYFHTEAMSSVVPRESWGYMPLRVEDSTRRLFELFAKHDVRATVFFLGWVAERCPRLVAEAVSYGHEIACHSYWHRPVHSLTPKEFREDTKRAQAVIEDAAGQAIYGYRAPSFSILHGMTWATDILADLGFVYDSSVNPIHHDLNSNPHARRTPHRMASGLLEFPVSTYRFGNLNLPMGGDGYLRVLPSIYSRLGLRQLASTGERLVIYMHPWEIDPEQPRLAAPLRSRLRQYTGLAGMKQRIEQLLISYKFGSIDRTFNIAHPAIIRVAYS